MNTRRISGIFLMVWLGCLNLALHAADGNLPEIDVLATVKINTNKEHQAIYAIALTNELNKALGIPTPLNNRRRNLELKDGAAHYRLFVDTTINATVGVSLITETEKAVATNNQRGDNYTIKHVYLGVTQQGSLQFRLTRWDETKYTDVEKWSTPVPRSEEELLYNGKVRIADITSTQSATPIKMEEAQQMALLKLMPGGMVDPIFAHWIQVSILKATPAGKGFDTELSIKNASPWCIKRFRAAVNYQGQLLCPGEAGMDGSWVAMKEPLLPTKDPAKVTAPALLAAKDVHPGLLAVEIAPIPAAPPNP